MNARPAPRLRVLVPVLTAAVLVLGATVAVAAPDRPSSIRAVRAASAAGQASAAA